MNHAILSNSRRAGRAVASALLALAAVLAAPTLPASAAAISAEEGSTRTLYLVLIRQARLDGKARAALAYLDDFDRQHPGDIEAQILRVNCLLDLGQVYAAWTAVSRIPAGIRNGAAQAARGHVLAAQGRWNEAAAQYGLALDSSPADPMIANALGYAQLRAGASEQAVETLKGALDLLAPHSAESAVARNNLGLALTMAGRPAEAARLIDDPRERKRLSAQFANEAARLLAQPAASGTGAPAL